MPYFIADNQERVTRIREGDNNASASQTKQASAKELTPIEKNLQQVAKALGIERGEPMTFEEANEMRGNPHFAEDVAYRVNCQTCVVANELRRRGLDVEALANLKGSALDRLSRHTESIWLDANGNIPVSILIPPKIERTVDKLGRVRNKVGGIDIQKLTTALEEEGRYHVKWCWKGKKNGHIVTVERLKDGTLRWYDPQCGSIDFFDLAYMAKLKDIKVLRVDNLRVNPEVAKNVLTRSGAKAKIGRTATDSGIAGKLRVIPKEECNYILPNGGSVSTPNARLAKGNLNKQEQAKFEKELRMARRYAEGGHKIEFVADDAGSFDVFIDGIKADFKSTSSPGNIIKYAKYATREQGAEIVLFEFTNWGSAFIEEIEKLKRYGIHGKYLKHGDSTIYTF